MDAAIIERIRSILDGSRAPSPDGALGSRGGLEDGGERERGRGREGGRSGSSWLLVSRLQAGEEAAVMIVENMREGEGEGERKGQVQEEVDDASLKGQTKGFGRGPLKGQEGSLCEQCNGCDDVACSHGCHVGSDAPQGEAGSEESEGLEDGKEGMEAVRQGAVRRNTRRGRKAVGAASKPVRASRGKSVEEACDVMGMSAAEREEELRRAVRAVASKQPARGRDGRKSRKDQEEEGVEQEEERVVQEVEVKVEAKRGGRRGGTRRGKQVGVDLDASGAEDIEQGEGREVAVEVARDARLVPSGDPLLPALQHADCRHPRLPLASLHHSFACLLAESRASMLAGEDAVTARQRADWWMRRQRIDRAVKDFIL